MIAGAGGVLFILQTILALHLMLSLRSASKERQRLNREMFGLLRKIEGLTSGKREQMMKHYDKILDDLVTRLPHTIASQAGTSIFETESRILTRLAELEPNLRNDELGRQKMDDLIQSMEGLESLIVSLTAETVQSVMAENRKVLFQDGIFREESMAA